MPPTTLPLTGSDFIEALAALKDKRDRQRRLLATLQTKTYLKAHGEKAQVAIEEAKATIRLLDQVIFRFEAAVEALA